MNRSYSNKGIVFLRFIFLFILFFILISSPVKAKAGQVGKDTAEALEPLTEEVLPEAKLNLKATSMVKGKNYALKVYNLTSEQTVVFKSDNEEIVSVDEDGLMTGLDYGSTVVTATVKEGGKTVTKLTCDVTVGAAAVSVKLTKQEYTLIVGKRITLKTILEPYTTVEEPKFISIDPSIATVSAGGRITAKSVGITTIYVFLDDKSKYDTCIISVVESIDESSEIDPLSANVATPTETPAK